MGVRSQCRGVSASEPKFESSRPDQYLQRGAPSFGAPLKLVGEKIRSSERQWRAGRENGARMRAQWSAAGGWACAASAVAALESESDPAPLPAIRVHPSSKKEQAAGQLMTISDLPAFIFPRNPRFPRRPRRFFLFNGVPAQQLPTPKHPTKSQIAEGAEETEDSEER